MIQAVRRMLTVIRTRRKRRMEKRLIFRDTFGKSITLASRRLFSLYFMISFEWGRDWDSKTRLCFVREQRNQGE